MDSTCPRAENASTYEYCPHALATVSNGQTYGDVYSAVRGARFYQAHGLGPGWQMRFGPNPVNGSKRRVAEHIEPSLLGRLSPRSVAGIVWKIYG